MLRPSIIRSSDNQTIISIRGKGDYIMTKFALMVGLSAAALALAGCQTSTGSGAARGAAMGAATGGSAAAGAVVGGTVGATQGSDTSQGAVSGAARGAALGAATGGSAATGAIIGGTSGAIRAANASEPAGTCYETATGNQVACPQ